MKLELEGIGIYVAKTAENNIKHSEKMTQTEMFPIDFLQEVGWLILILERNNILNII